MYVFGEEHAVCQLPASSLQANDALKPYPAPPGSAEVKPDSAGYLALTRKGVDEDFVPELPAAERAVVYATQGPWNSKALGDKVATPAWTTKPSWYIIVNDRMLQPRYERDVAKHIHATATTLTSGHVPMLSMPAKVAAVITDAANRAGK